MLIIVPKQVGNFSQLYNNELGTMGAKIDNIIHAVWRGKTTKLHYHI